MVRKSLTNYNININHIGRRKIVTNEEGEKEKMWKTCSLSMWTSASEKFIRGYNICCAQLYPVVTRSCIAYSFLHSSQWRSVW